MIAKVIAHGPDRVTALERLRGALAATRIEGIKTNLAFQQRILADAEFARGGVDTGFLARMMEKEPA
jgi:acetyl/propionyl-CoA carboxylase alpha subunit